DDHLPPGARNEPGADGGRRGRGRRAEARTDTEGLRAGGRNGFAQSEGAVSSRIRRSTGRTRRSLSLPAASLERITSASEATRAGTSRTTSDSASRERSSNPAVPEGENVMSR